jgi:hypothetical protein
LIELEKMGLYIPFDKDRYHKYLARYALLPLSVITFILVSTFSLDATVIFDFEGPVLIDPGKKVKDHSLILVDGLFHIFYIRGDGTSFGHATSPDLLHWTIQSPVLETGPESWDSNNIWAPCIVSYPNSSHTLLMYYTGVNGFAAQRTCLASTVEPSTWHKVPTRTSTLTSAIPASTRRTARASSQQQSARKMDTVQLLLRGVKIISTGRMRDPFTFTITGTSWKARSS